MEPGARRAKRTRLPTGWPALDGLLTGGWPHGCVCELCGRGRTSLALGAVLQAQRADLPVAWVDGTGGFCPATARVDLTTMTLVRTWPGASSTAARRVEGRRPPRAGRSGAVNRALLATDLLLRSRAFALVVLDMPDGRPALSRWFRLARLAETSRSWLLLLAGEDGPRAGSAAELGVKVALRPRRSAAWEPPVPPRLKVSVLRHRGVPGLAESRVLLEPLAWRP